MESCSSLLVALLTAQAEGSSRASISGDLAVGNADAGTRAQAEAYDSRCVSCGLCRQRPALFCTNASVVAVLLIVVSELSATLLQKFHVATLAETVLVGAAIHSSPTAPHLLGRLFWTTFLHVHQSAAGAMDRCCGRLWRSGPCALLPECTTPIACKYCQTAT